MLDTIIDHEQGSSPEVSNDLISNGTESIKARLERGGLKNNQILTESSAKLAEKEQSLASARRTHAEADALEVDTNVRRLRIALKGQKALLFGEAGEDSLLFGKQIDALLEAIDEAQYPGH